MLGARRPLRYETMVIPSTVTNVPTVPEISVFEPLPSVRSNNNNYGLKPLENNPLRATSHLEFCAPLSPNDPYLLQYPEWCQSVSSFVPPITQTFFSLLNHFEKKMGMEEAELIYDRFVDRCFTVIDGALERLSKDLKLYETAAEINAIYINLYQLVVNPLRGVVAYYNCGQYIGDKYAISVQNYFRHQLSQRLPMPLSDLNNIILNEVVSGIPYRRLNETSQMLRRKYPHSGTVIKNLVAKAHLLVEEMNEFKEQKIRKYRFENGDVQFCLHTLFRRNENFLKEFMGLLRGDVYSDEEYPRMHHTATPPSYIKMVAELLKACEMFVDRKDSLEQFREHCKRYREYREKVKVFQSSVSVIRILDAIQNLRLWPGEYELSNGELYYISGEFYTLKRISYHHGDEKPLIPYDYLKKNLSHDKSDNARENMRRLYHARIPWKMLQTIGNLSPTKGGALPEERRFNLQLVRDSFDELQEDLKYVEQSIVELLDFEASGLLTAPPEWKWGYEKLNLLASLAENRQSLPYSLALLKDWKALTVHEQLDHPSLKVKYAALRTVQVLGETAKNLQQVGLLAKDKMWGKLAEVRNDLSHMERGQTARRVELLVKKGDGAFVKELHQDFMQLSTFFDNFTHHFPITTRWSEAKVWKNNKISSNFNLPGIEELFLLFNRKLSLEEEEELEKSLTTGLVASINVERAIILLEFKNDQWDDFETKVKKLPLNRSEQDELIESIKIVRNTKIASNAYGLSLAKAKTKIANLKKNNDPKLKDQIALYEKQLAETENDFITRKQKYLNDALNGIVLDDAKAKGEELIQKMLGKAPPAWEVLEVELKKIGVADLKLWEKCLKKCLPKGESTNTKHEVTKVSATRRVKLLMQAIYDLKAMFSGQKVYYENLQPDPFLRLANQYLFSTMRKHASELIKSIDHERIFFPQYDEFLKKIQETLQGVKEQANQLCHLHEITEPGSLTAAGHGMMEAGLFNVLTDPAFIKNLTLLRGLDE